MKLIALLIMLFIYLPLHLGCKTTPSSTKGSDSSEQVDVVDQKEYALCSDLEGFLVVGTKTIPPDVEGVLNSPDIKISNEQVGKLTNLATKVSDLSFAARLKLLELSKPLYESAQKGGGDLGLKRIIDLFIAQAIPPLQIFDHFVFEKQQSPTQAYDCYLYYIHQYFGKDTQRTLLTAREILGIAQQVSPIAQRKSTDRYDAYYEAYFILGSTFNGKSNLLGQSDIDLFANTSLFSGDEILMEVRARLDKYADSLGKGYKMPVDDIFMENNLASFAVFSPVTVVVRANGEVDLKVYSEQLKVKSVTDNWASSGSSNVFERLAPRSFHFSSNIDHSTWKVKRRALISSIEKELGRCSNLDQAANYEILIEDTSISDFWNELNQYMIQDKKVGGYGHDYMSSRDFKTYHASGMNQNLFPIVEVEVSRLTRQLVPLLVKCANLESVAANELVVKSFLGGTQKLNHIVAGLNNGDAHQIYFVIRNSEALNLRNNKALIRLKDWGMGSSLLKSGPAPEGFDTFDYKIQPRYYQLDVSHGPKFDY